MPLQGVFNADFTAFTAACAAAETSLKGFETGASKTEAALNKMADSVSGQKIVQQAMLATKAVEDVGGAAVLTEKELAKMSAIAAEGAEKLTKMGQTVPADMQRLANETKGAAEATGSWSSALSTAQGYLSAFGITASIGGIVAFGESIFHTASEIHDMGERLGISAEAVQGFKFAAEQAGSSLDAVGSAITKMNKNLAEGDKSTIDALQKAGLEFATIRNMKPEDAFLAITDAIAKIPDPMERSDVTLKLFGKSAAELLPAITEGFRAAADGAQKMSNATVDALERAEDAWTKLRNTVVIVSGTIIAGTIDTTTHITSSWQNFWQFMKDSASMGVGMAAALATANEQIKTSVDDFVGPLEKGLHATKADTEAAEAAAKKYGEAWAVLNSLGTSYADTVAQINPKIAEQAEYYLRVGASVAEVAAAFPQLTAAQVKALDEMVKNHEAMLKKIQALEENHVKQQETNYLGLSKAENDASQKSIENFGKANAAIMAMNATLSDDYKKQTLDRFTYENLKIWEAADAQIEAFKKTGATAQQVTQFSDALYEHTATAAAAVYGTSKDTLVNITDEGIRQMMRLVADHEKELADAAQKAKAAADEAANAWKNVRYSMESSYTSGDLQARAAKTPGSSVERDYYGNEYLYIPGVNAPPPSVRAPGIQGFASGVENFAGGLAIVGERGPELVNLPAGSDVIPGGVGGTSVTNHIYVNGTAADVARQVAAEIMKSLKSTQQLTLR